MVGICLETNNSPSPENLLPGLCTTQLYLPMLHCGVHSPRLSTCKSAPHCVQYRILHVRYMRGNNELHIDCLWNRNGSRWKLRLTFECVHHYSNEAQIVAMEKGPTVFTMDT